MTNQKRIDKYKKELCSTCKASKCKNRIEVTEVREQLYGEVTRTVIVKCKNFYTDKKRSYRNPKLRGW